MWGGLLRSGRNATAFSESVKMPERNEKNKLDLPKILREKVEIGGRGGEGKQLGLLYTEIGKDP